MANSESEDLPVIHCTQNPEENLKTPSGAPKIIQLKSLPNGWTAPKMSTDKGVIRKLVLEQSTAAANAMRKDDVFTDVVLVCEDREFPAHSLVLAAASPYFSAMLQTPMTEANTGKIELKTLDPDVVELVLSFIYMGRIHVNFEDHGLCAAVIEASHMLQVESLFQYTIRGVVSELTSDSFIEIWNTLELYNQTELLTEVKKTLAVNFENVSTSKDFLHMRCDQLQELLVLIEPISIDVTLLALLKWIKSDEEARIGDLSVLFKHLNVERLTLNCLRDLLSNEPLVQHCQPVYSLLVTRMLQFLGSELPEWSRMSIGSKLMCFAKQGGISKVFVKEDKWSEPTTLSFTLAHGISILGYRGDIYLIGCRHTDNRNPDEVWKYSPATKASPFVLKLKFPVRSAVAVDLNDFIYVVGGFDTQSSIPTPTNLVQRFNPTTKECEELQSTNEAHWFPVVGQLNDYLYIAGNSGTVERYNPETNQWTFMTPIPVQPFGCCGAFGEGKLYLMPDKRSPNDLLVYNPNRKYSWEAWETKILDGTGPSEITGRWTVRTHEPHRSVMLVQDKSKALYCFNPGSNSWKWIAPASSDKFDYAEFCVVVTYTSHYK